MKKALTFLVVLSLFVCIASAEGTDLSGLSFDDLVALKDQINLEMWNRAEWQEVIVPQGIYEVGVDIPEGHWTIKAADGARTYVYWGDSMMDVSMVSPDHLCLTLDSPSSEWYEENQSRIEVDADLSVGQFIQIDSGKAVFTPYSGKPSLGFK